MNAHKTLASALVTFFGLLALCGPAHEAYGQDGDLQSVLVKAKAAAVKESYLLRYTFAKGESLRWKVRHLGTTETTVRGNTQTSKMRAVSTKQWKVVDVDEDGNIRFVHSVLDVDMWQKVSGREEVRFNSKEDKTPPTEYVQAAKSVGVPIATVQISPSGKVLERDKAPSQIQVGLGTIAVPLPVEPVKIGQNWQLSSEVRVRRQGGQMQRIKTRLVYTLESVKTGVATVSVRTEVLTPVSDPKIKAQLVPMLTNGELKFDVDAGRVLARKIDWDETIVGFSGDDSLMKHLARFTEELIPADQVAKESTGPAIR